MNSTLRTGKDDPTNCGACHGNFRTGPYEALSDGSNWGDDLHDTHREGMLNGDCDTCHSSGSRFPVILDSSVGGDGLAPVSCVGCHGRAEDDSVANGGACAIEDCGPAAGLRQHHFRAGVTVCLDCHDNADPANYMPVGEDVLPSYYANPGTGHPNIPSDSCDDNFVGGPQGLDNDGDGDYDGNDTDCGANRPPVISGVHVTPYSGLPGTMFLISATVTDDGGVGTVTDDGQRLGHRRAPSADGQHNG